MEKPVTIAVDDGIRPGATLSDLARLKAVFKKDGTTTAGNDVILESLTGFLLHGSYVIPFYLHYIGNSSQVSDGAGAVLLMRRSVAVHKGLPILGVFRYCVF